MITSAHAILRRRDPRASLWWVAVSWALPIAGPLLYYLMGINRIRRGPHTAARMRPAATPSPAILYSRATDPSAIPPRLRYLMSLTGVGEKVSGVPITESNRVSPLKGGHEALSDMVKAIDGATASVGLTSYIFKDDAAGRPLIDALERAQGRGAAVRVIADDIGSRYAKRPAIAELLRRKIPARYFMPTLLPTLRYFNLRSHRKLLVVDGNVAFTGGMNIHEGHLRNAGPDASQDLHFRLEGPVVEQLQKTFREDWLFVSGENLTGPAWFPETRSAGPVLARAIADGPDERLEQCRWIVLGALSQARESVRIMSPYFVPDPTLINALDVAALRGVRVDIVLPSTSDLRLVKWASQAILWEVLIRGCRVWFTPPPFDHTKLMVVDEAWTLIGSTNWDARSFRLNFELNVECYGEEFGTRMARFVDDKIAGAREIRLADMQSRPFPIELRDGIAKLFAPHL